MFRPFRIFLPAVATWLCACGAGLPASTVLINEVVTSNDGVYVDEYGELDDWLEIINAGSQAVDLSGFNLTDSGGEPAALPGIRLQPGEVIVLFADDSPEQGDRHLPFKLSSSGEVLSIFDATGAVIDQVSVPKLEQNQAYTRFGIDGKELAVCRYTSPNRPNGDNCQSTATPGVNDDIRFESFPETSWPQPVVPGGLAINEIALLPADFIEIINLGDEARDLGEFTLALTRLSPLEDMPPPAELKSLAMPAMTLMPGEVIAIPLSEADVASIIQQPLNEGAAVLFERSSEIVVDQIPFMYWPSGAALARTPGYPFALQFCTNTSPGAVNVCEILATREIGDRTRGLYTPGDFSKLADGSGLAGMESVKFVIDLQSGSAVHYLSARRWPLHYSFVREIIDQDPPLDRCDPVQEQQFNEGWLIFSQENYYNTTTRRYHLGTLSKHANANIHAVEFTPADAITPEQMRYAFFTAVVRTQNPLQWALRPQNAGQINRAREIEGSLPVVGPNAPFQNVLMQTLAPGVAYGTLQFIPTEDLGSAILGPRVIVITNDVPNDIDFVGGLVTEAFQTPLAHVNVLSQGRGTPNLALPDAHRDPLIQPLLGKLVRFEVTSGGYTFREASLAEAEDYWAGSGQVPEILTPRLDNTTRALVDLRDASLDTLPAIGAKAAQLAELYRVTPAASSCSEGVVFDLPEDAFAIPMSFYLEHLAGSGAGGYLEQEMQSEIFKTDLDYRRLTLLSVQQMILEHPVDTQLLRDVESRLQERFGSERVRFRSSSNTEDLSTFNGAGLYDSLSAAIGDDERRIDDAIRAVWASLWNLRAFEERSYANVDQSQVAMAVLVHRAFRNERANGVAIARNILDLTRADQYFVNTQVGEASVTNPAPGVVTEQVIYQWPPRTPRLTYHSHSSLLEGTVISATEIRGLACAMEAIQSHFKAQMDPFNENRWFTMETEFKFLGEQRQLLIKQARPFPLINRGVPEDCREI